MAVRAIHAVMKAIVVQAFVQSVTDVHTQAKDCVAQAMRKYIHKHRIALCKLWMYIHTYCTCPYKGLAQVVPGAQMETGSGFQTLALCSF